MADESFAVPLAYQTERHAGMPALANDERVVSWFEFLPMWVFYAPLAVYMVWLTVRYGGLLSPSLANPEFPNGGLFGESKRRILDVFGQHARAVTADYTVLKVSGNAGQRFDEAIAFKEEKEIDYPLVAKPDIGCRGAGVKLVENDEQLKAYVSGFPEGAEMLMQAFVPWEGEAGVFFIRQPGEQRGRIFSLTLKYLPFVEGDGKATLGELIKADKRAGQVPHLYLERHKDQLDMVVPKGEAVRLAFSGSHCRGAVFRDGGDFVTPQLLAAFERIADDIPEFYFGRFDVRFRDIESLQRGESFRIIELNGGGAEATHVWDARTTLRTAYKTLAEQYRLLWSIGFKNRKRGFKPTPARTQIQMHLLERSLTRQYPATD